MDVLVWLAVGLVTGMIAHWLTPRRRHPHGVSGDIMIGIAGAVLGGWLSEQLGWKLLGGLPGTIAVALFGALVCLSLLRLLQHAIRD